MHARDWPPGRELERTILRSLDRFEHVIARSRELAQIRGYEAMAEQAEINAEACIAETLAVLDDLRANAAKRDQGTPGRSRS